MEESQSLETETIKIESTDQILSILRGMTDDESVIAKIALGLKEANTPISATYSEEYVAETSQTIETPETLSDDTSQLQIKETKRLSNRRKKLKVTKEPKIMTLKDSSKKDKKSKSSQLTEIHLF